MRTLLYHARLAHVRLVAVHEVGGRVRRVKMTATVVAVIAVAVVSVAYGRSEPLPATRARQAVDTGVFDRLLDLYVRDGLVYYAALKVERAALGRFVEALEATPTDFDLRPRDDRKAFWINAYNALVLQTVVDHYPIRGQSPDYPTNSIRQIPGAFGRREHAVAGQVLTLDEIESTLMQFSDPRVFLALGRGAVDSGRLRSETYTSSRLDAQLDAALQEFATTPRHVNLDQLGQEVRVSPIFGWRENEFVGAYAARGWTDSGRTALERAILTAIEPKLFPSERAFLEGNRFSLQYHEFDWRLNDLTGGRP